MVSYSNSDPSSCSNLHVPVSLEKCTRSSSANTPANEPAVADGGKFDMASVDCPWSSRGSYLYSFVSKVFTTPIRKGRPLLIQVKIIRPASQLFRCLNKHLSLPPRRAQSHAVYRYANKRGQTFHPHEATHQISKLLWVSVKACVHDTGEEGTVLHRWERRIGGVSRQRWLSNAVSSRSSAEKSRFKDDELTDLIRPL